MSFMEAQFLMRKAKVIQSKILSITQTYSKWLERHLALLLVSIALTQETLYFRKFKTFKIKWSKTSKSGRNKLKWKKLRNSLTSNLCAQNGKDRKWFMWLRLGQITLTHTESLEDTIKWKKFAMEFRNDSLKLLFLKFVRKR